MSLMPCFDAADQARTEGTIVGRLLVGYGELEVQLLACHFAVENIYDLPIRDLFSDRGEKRRLKTSKAALRSDYTRAGLIGDLLQTFDDLDWCRQIRNQYAHCQWYWTRQDGLCFVNLEELAQQPTTILNDLTVGRHSIDLPLLNAQEAFFWYVKECLMHLGDAYRDWDRRQGAVAGPAIYVHPKPQLVARPPLHN